LEASLAKLSLSGGKSKGAGISKSLSPAELDIIKTKEPLYGLVSRKVSGSRIRLALVSLESTDSRIEVDHPLTMRIVGK
jgi:hypothetical protein